MLFSSLTFLYCFLPLVCGLYFLTPKGGRNLVLLFASLFFYFYGEPSYLLVMIASTLSAFLFGLWIGRAKRPRLPLVLSVSVSLSFLLFFKYTDFFLSNLKGLLGAEIPLLRLALPIGISFYTFQAISYTVDVYRGDAAVQKNLIDFAAYIALFPQLIAGPIVRYSLIAGQLRDRKETLRGVSLGLTRFATGLGKKVLFANVLGELVEKLSAAPERDTLSYWVTAIAYTLQIYFDFSGYSDMAVGLGGIFGFDFPENFNYPFVSGTVTDFWRRWHMSLGSWFRDYVYIPLGGNRVSLLKWLRNILVVWFLTGFWHGASWNFVLWGLYFAVFLLLEKLFLKKLLQRLPRFLSHVYLLLVVLISFVLFQHTDLSAFTASLGGMFRLREPAPYTLYMLKSYGVLLAASLLGATPLIKNTAAKLFSLRGGERIQEILRPAYVVSLLLLVTAFLIDGSYNPFLYFRF